MKRRVSAAMVDVLKRGTFIIPPVIQKSQNIPRWSRAAEKSTSQLTCEDQNLASGVLADSAGGTADPSPRGSGSWSGCDCGDDDDDVEEEDCVVMRGERSWREYTEGERLLADESIVVLSGE